MPLHGDTPLLNIVQIFQVTLLVEEDNVRTAIQVNEQSTAIYLM